MSSESTSVVYFCLVDEENDDDYQDDDECSLFTLCRSIWHAALPPNVYVV